MSLPRHKKHWLIGVLVSVAVAGGLAGCTEQGLALARPKALQPSQVVVVIMAGWLEGYWAMDPIERAVRNDMSMALPRDGSYRIVFKRKGAGLLLEGDYDLFLRLEYLAWKQRKKTDAGRYDEFIAIGHSSGATAIYNELRNGTFDSGQYMPALLGMVDMILPVGPHDLTGKIPFGAGRQTSVVHYYVPGTEWIQGATNLMSPGSNHFSILTDPSVTQGLASRASLSCMQAFTNRRMANDER